MAALFAALPSAQHDMDAATLKEFESLTPEKKALVHAHLGNTDVAAMLLDPADGAHDEVACALGAACYNTERVDEGGALFARARPPLGTCFS